MLIEVKVPVLPESVAEATLVSWHKKAGESVRRDENLIDVETDKVVLELPAPDSGVIAEIRKPDGATVMAQEVIAVIDTAAKATAAKSAVVAGAAAAPPSPTATAVAAQDNVSALPSARKLMADQGVAAAQVTGTGRGGRITKGDVLDGSTYPVNRAGFVIHSAIHDARHDAHCVMHTHTTAGMAVVIGTTCSNATEASRTWRLPARPVICQWVSTRCAIAPPTPQWP